ncbi:MAG: Gldg family protein [Promethearchaeota archaeon]
MSKVPFYIAFDESHKPRGRIDSNYTELKKHLESLGFVCHQFMEFPITRENLKPYDILAIPCPDFSKFSKQEIDAITKWVREDGGGLLLLSHAGGDKGRRSNLSELAEKFGIQFENDQILDKTKNFGIENLPEITNFTPPHPITEGITSICFRAGSSLSTFGVSAVPVVLSNETSDPFSTPLIVAVEADKGRVVGCGSYEIFRDKIAGGFGHDQHAKLAENIFNWLKTDYRIELKEKSPEKLPGPKAKPPRAPQLTSNISALPQSPSVTAQQPSFTIQSNITISNKSDLANLFNNLLQQIDVIRQQVKAIIDTIVSSEEKVIEETPSYYQPPSQPQASSQTVDFASLNPPSPTVNPPSSSSTPSTSLLGDQIDEGLTPLPPKPPSLQGYTEYTTVDQSQYNNQQYTSDQYQYNSSYNYQPYTTLPDSTEQPYDNPYEQHVFEPSEAQPPTKNAETDATSQSSSEAELKIDDIQAEIETLQSKINSIEDLKRLVEQKFQQKKYTKKQYDKQMNRLENDKKKAIFRLEELEHMLKKLKK